MIQVAGHHDNRTVAVTDGVVTRTLDDMSTASLLAYAKSVATGRPNLFRSDESGEAILRKVASWPQITDIYCDHETWQKVLMHAESLSGICLSPIWLCNRYSDKWIIILRLLPKLKWHIFT